MVLPLISCYLLGMSVMLPLLYCYVVEMRSATCMSGPKNLQ